MTVPAVVTARDSGSTDEDTPVLCAVLDDDREVKGNPVNVHNAGAYDAAFEDLESADSPRPDPLLSELAWLYELEIRAKRGGRSENRQSADEAVDEVLMQYWQHGSPDGKL
jgi:hypothetical protein